ncbi:hypothetical protein BKI52_03745 [marine bacterium AO1-C]|nr:hypothetical protein BKI52_03745 [marine bacterium AO1-C]
MKRIYSLYIIWVLTMATAQAQTTLTHQPTVVADSLTLQYCYDQTVKNYPLQHQKKLLYRQNSLKQASLRTAQKPQMFLNASAVYVSDVTSLPIDLPGGVSMPELSKDRYQATLDVTQTLYNGGLTKKQMQVEAQQLKADQQQIEVQLYQLKGQVNAFYFNTLLLQANEQTLAVLEKNLQNNLQLIKARIKNGVLLPSDSSLIKAEIVKVHQQIEEVEYSRRASLATLGKLMRINLPLNTYLKAPKSNTLPKPTKRPEYQLFELQKQSLHSMEKVVGATNKPRVSAFVQLGYGRPGLNMLSNDFEGFYQFGVRLNWKIWDWGNRSRDLQQLRIKQALVQNQQEVFQTNLEVQTQKYAHQIEQLERLIKRDQEIIDLRQQIVKSSKAQMKNGVITTTQYLEQLNEASRAQIMKQTHQIQLLRTKVEYQTLQGN